MAGPRKTHARLGGVVADADAIRAASAGRAGRDSRRVALHHPADAAPPSARVAAMGYVVVAGYHAPARPGSGARNEAPLVPSLHAGRRSDRIRPARDNALALADDLCA